jgi:hypothetical protein
MIIMSVRKEPGKKMNGIHQESALNLAIRDSNGKEAGS